MGLNVIAQSFLQWIMAEKVVTTKEAVKIFNQCVDRANGREASKLKDSDSLERQVGKINSQLEFAEFQIKSMYSPWAEERYWALCNTIEDEASRVGMHMSKSEVELFFTVMDELREFGGCMDLVEAQNVATQHEMPVSEKGRMIQRLHQLQWLTIDRNQLTPGPRAIIELPKVRQWVREVAQEMRGRGRDEVKSQAVAEEEVEEESEDEVRQRRGVRRRRRSSQLSRDDDMEMDEEEEEGESRRASQARAVRRGARRSGR